MNPSCLQYRLTDEERRTFNETGLLQIENALSPGDTIKFGGTQFRFQTRSSKAQSAELNVPLSAPLISNRAPLHQPKAVEIEQNIPFKQNGAWQLMGTSGLIQLPPAPALVPIGRSDQNFIVLNDPAISSNHALINVEFDGLKITDLQSKNGVVVNGQRIPPGIATALRLNDRLTLGQQDYTILRA